MAVVTVQDSKKTLREAAELGDFLAQYRIAFERWPIPAEIETLRVRPALSQDDQQRVIKSYDAFLQRERRERGYIQVDMVVLNPSTPNLETILAKFDKPHYHDDEEVRYIVDGEGVFGFEPANAKPFTVLVSAGDYIIVPANIYHWFALTATRSIKALRLFKDMSGWVPHYKNAMG